HLSISNTPVNITVFNAEGRLRWHPFRGAFFIGSAFGYQKINADTSKDMPIGAPVNASVPLNIALQTSGAYIMPHFGWLWGFASRGFFMGLDLGAQIPINSKNSFDV